MTTTHTIAGRSARIAFAILQLVFLGLVAGEMWVSAAATTASGAADDASLIESNAASADFFLEGQPHHTAGPVGAGFTLPSSPPWLSDHGGLAPAAGPARRAIPLLHQAPKLSPPA